ncbi:MAG TPA: MarR family transcriptional regulator [archaeon]|nr:MarR family transcriptional regulator [archaeon]
MPIPRETLRANLREGALRILDLLAKKPEQALSMQEIAQRLRIDERSVSSVVLALSQKGLLDVTVVKGKFYCALSDKVENPMAEEGFAGPADSPALRSDPDTLRYIG